MTLESFNTVFLTCLFLVPGYIVAKTRNAFCATHQDETDITLLQYLLFSIMNCGVWSWAYMIVLTRFPVKTSISFWLWMLIITVLGAYILGFIIGFLTSEEVMHRLLEKAGININLPDPTAWDYKFRKLSKKNSYVIITISEHETICGYYANSSAASSEADDRDLYLEKYYTLDENKHWIEQKNTDGILIMKDKIRSIEFYDGNPTTSEPAKTDAEDKKEKHTAKKSKQNETLLRVYPSRVYQPHSEINTNPPN